MKNDMTRIWHVVVGAVVLASCGGVSGPSDGGGGGADAAAAGPLCQGLVAMCGPSRSGSCCESPLVSGGTYYRSYDGIDATTEDGTNQATVSDFRLDKYEITVGRFRAFANAGYGTQAQPPAAGAGANPYLDGTGWDDGWNTNLVTDAATLMSKAGVECSATLQTWTETPEGNEDRPMNCLTWYEAFAFCAWDGGFLPTEAEWNYAAAGGSEQRYYPWSSAYPPGATAIEATDAVYDAARTANVGSRSPTGDGRYGQADLAGNVWEWVLDGYGAYPTPCADCANLTDGPQRVIRGGGFFNFPSPLRAAGRYSYDPTKRYSDIGVRCARIP